MTDGKKVIMRFDPPRTRLGRTIPVVAAVLLVTAGAAAVASASGPNSHQHARHHEVVEPVPTTDADWQPVVDTLGRKGKLSPDNLVYRIGLPRTDLNVTSQGVAIKPGFALGGYTTWTKYEDMVMVMGDFVVTEPELQAVTDALQANGIDQTAVHKHLLAHSPDIWWTHIHAMGDPAALASAVKAALDVTAIPPPVDPGPPPPIDLDTAGIDNALGRMGTNDGGIYKFTIGRAETIIEDDHHLPVALGFTTALNFQPIGNHQAAINGDFVMIRDEVQKVIQALRAAGISIVEVHNHGLGEDPRLFYMHFWATGDGVALAQGLRTATDATNLIPPTR